MKILLLTAAGMSSRFSKSIGRQCLKCIFYKESIEETLIYKMLKRHIHFDKIVIVGGFMFDNLKSFCDNYFKELNEKIILVNNEKYAEYGSGYSLFLGLEIIKNINYTELVFAEGDLFVDDNGFDAVCMSPKSVMTYNTEPIYADRSVAFYFDKDKKPHYIYDVYHGLLTINEPFLSVFNSGQIWKFKNPELLKKIMCGLEHDELKKTNLIPVNKYFGELSPDETEIIGFKKWINCNTIEDFESMEEKI